MSDENPFAVDAEGSRLGQPQYQPARKTNGMLIGCLVVALMVPVLGVCAGLLLPAIQAAREASRRMTCSNNMKEIGLALRNYESAYGSLPPAYTVDSAGNRLHSWRALILPYLEEQSLHNQIDFSKPWDDPANQAVASTIVPTYSCPSTTVEPTMTTYVAVEDPSGIMSGSTPTLLNQILDGLSSTVMVVETDSANAVHWMEPRDIDLLTFLDVGSARNQGGHVGGAHVLFADGAVSFVTDTMDLQLREDLVSKAGEQQLEELEPVAE